MTSDEARKVFAWIEDYTDGDPVSFTHDEVRRMRDAMSLMFAGDSSDVRVRAKELRMIVERFFHGAQTSEHMYAMLESLERRATTAILSAARVPDGCVREGVTDRKVLGEPVVTADGAYVFKNARVVCPNGHEGAKVLGTQAWCGEDNCWDEGCQGDGPSGSTYPGSECFSELATRDAALAARKEGAK